MWFTILSLIGGMLLAVLVIAKREGAGWRVWPLWLVLAVLCLGIGLGWPEGAAL